MKKVFMITILGLGISLGVCTLAEAKTYNYNEPVTLTGIIKLENDYPFLYLQKGINVNKADFYDAAKNVKRMQVININRKPGEKTPLGCQVVHGSLFGWETAHHQTPVLIQAESFDKCK